MILEEILQADILVKFIYPFLLIFFVLFAVLEKTKVLGDDKSQLNALVSFVVSLIFISFVFPVMIVENLMVFLSIAIIIILVALLLWGFIMGNEGLDIFGKSEKWFKIVVAVVIIIAVVLAVLWASGIDSGVINFLFHQSWSKSLWTSVLFIVVVAIALAVVLKTGSD
ncbi:MAG: hypothetical protein ACOC3Z_02045 [Nanoarchaeota archaeon]